MKRLFSFLFLTAGVFSFLPVEAKMMNSVWIPYWEKSGGAAEVKANLDKLSSISPFAYSVGPKGELKDTAKLGEAPWTALFARARAKKVKILPSILWTDSAAIDRTLAATSSRRAHLEAIKKEIAAGSFDGIDIDYENKYASTSPYFSAFLRELADIFHPQGKILSCTIEARTPPESRFLVVPAKLEYANDYREIGRYCDEVRLMAYDQGTADIKLNQARRLGGYYYPVADQAWVRKVLDLALKDLPANKVVLGIPSYGYELEVIDKKKFFDYRKVRSVSYKDFLALAKKTGKTIKRSNAGEAYFVFASSSATHFVTVSDEKAIEAKVRLAKIYNLKGVAIYRADGKSDNFWRLLK